jgi:hypothetical protein
MHGKLVVAAMIEAIRLRSLLIKWTAVKQLFKSIIVWCISVIADKRSSVFSYALFLRHRLAVHADRDFVKSML